MAILLIVRLRLRHRRAGEPWRLDRLALPAAFFGPAVFAALLDRRKGGRFAVAPAGPGYHTPRIPRRQQCARNWDYRFCWLRGALLSLSAFQGLGYHGEAAAFLGWLLDVTRLTWPELQVLYDVYGEANIPERSLDHLEGYRDSRPVRIGNAAHEQRQLDIYGALIQAAFDFVHAGGQLAVEERSLLVLLGETVCQLWRQPDHGIWETRGAPRHFVFSKLMCWVAIDHLIALKDVGVLRAPDGRFRRERQGIRTAIERHGFDPAVGACVAAFDASGEADGALLQLARLGFHNSDDRRVCGTEAHIRRCLGLPRGLIARYLTKGQDALPPGEGAFAACAFWAVEACALRGDRSGAANEFAALATLANDGGLLAEEIAPDTGDMLGPNFPQGFTRLALINAALALCAAPGSRRAASRSSPAISHER